MSDIRLEGDFEKYLLSSYQILEKDLYRLIDDLTGTFNDSVEMFVQKRHFSLQKEGKRNKEIYTILQDEVKSQRFIAPELSQRQIRRMIYG